MAEPGTMEDNFKDQESRYIDVATTIGYKKAIKYLQGDRRVLSNTEVLPRKGEGQNHATSRARSIPTQNYAFLPSNLSNISLRDTTTFLRGTGRVGLYSNGEGAKSIALEAVS